MVQKIILLLISILLCTTIVSAEVGQFITIKTTTVGNPIPITTSSGGGDSSRNSNNCQTKVNATNLNTGTCGEYNICYLPPLYEIRDSCIEPAPVKIMPPPGTYSRGGVEFIDEPVAQNEPIADVVVIKEEIINTTEEVIVAELNKEGDEQVESIYYNLIIFIIFLLALFVLGIVLLLRQLWKNKKQKQQSPPEYQSPPKTEQISSQMYQSPPEYQSPPIQENTNLKQEDWRDF